MVVSLARTAREALTNAGKHAPGVPVTMTLTYADDVRLSVRNPAPADAVVGRDGFGLTGMRERLALVGGTVRAGVDGDRWTVTAIVPG